MKRRKRTQAELTLEMHNSMALLCLEIEELYQSYGLPMTKVTVVARDPEDDDMYNVCTNEDDDGLKKACKLALQPPATTTEKLKEKIAGRSANA